MSTRAIPLDDETFERLEAVAAREGKSVDELVKVWMEDALLAAGVVGGIKDKQADREALKLRERAARAAVHGFSARDNLSRSDLYRG
jgi:predicted DNA-binding protein